MQSQPRHIRYHPVPGSWRRRLSPALPEKAFQIPNDIPPGHIYYITKGRYIGSGATSFVEKLKSGYIVKYPKPNPYSLRDEESRRRDMQIEADVYQRIGNSPYVPKLIQWDEQSCCLTLEYLDNGDLGSYLRNTATEKSTTHVTYALRKRWTVQAAEALAVVHAADVVHCDVTPRNFMLNATLDLHIAYFAGSSVAGSAPPVTTSPRFQPPGWNWKRKPEKADDIFALGSVMYFIMTEQEPYNDLDDDQVEGLFKEAKFPDVSELTGGDIIRGCWTGSLGSARQVASALTEQYSADSRGDTTEVR